MRFTVTYRSSQYSEVINKVSSEAVLCPNLAVSLSEAVSLSKVGQ